MKPQWKRITSKEPPQGVPVRTRINDHRGIRNEAMLYRQGRLWFFEDGSMYVYYTPTEYLDPRDQELERRKSNA